MKLLMILLCVGCFIGCAGQSKNVTMFLINSNKAYKVEGKLIDDISGDYLGLIYGLKVIKECPPCDESDDNLLKHGFYTLGIDSNSGGTWYVPTYIFSTSKNNYAQPYKRGLPGDSLDSLLTRKEK